jgi:hypothetical protein
MMNVLQQMIVMVAVSAPIFSYTMNNEIHEREIRLNVRKKSMCEALEEFGKRQGKFLETLNSEQRQCLRYLEDDRNWLEKSFKYMWKEEGRIARQKRELSKL